MGHERSDEVARPVGVSPLLGWRLFAAALAVLATAGIGRQAGMTAVAALVPREGLPETDGFVLSAGILTASSLASLTLWLILRTRAPRRYLALERPSVGAVAIALLGSALLVVAFDAARWGATGSVIPGAWQTIARTAPWPLLVVAFAVAAPCFEEAFFRGFLHTSLRETRFGRAGAIALTSILFTLAHGPEDAISFFEPLAGAVFLGVLRERTGSVVPGIAAHALGNLAALGATLLA
jgi:membrane protease YdiL (CAAX protease family)